MVTFKGGWVKGLLAELAPPHAQSTKCLRFYGEMVRVAGLIAYCNYFYKKKIKKKKNI